MKTKLFITIIVVLCISGTIFSQTKDPNIILDNVKKAFEEIQDYKADVHLKIDVEFLKVPESDAILYYKQPNKVHIESEKFALMPKRGLNFSPLGLIRGKYTALYEREDTIRNIPVSVVKTIPIGNKNDIILNTFWIDQKRNLVIRVETSRRPSGTYSMDFIYENIDDQYLLPLSLEFTFTVDPSMFRRHRGFDMQENDSEKQNKKESKDGKVFIKFSNYEVNTGLSDEIFEKKKSENDTDD